VAKGCSDSWQALITLAEPPVAFLPGEDLFGPQSRGQCPEVVALESTHLLATVLIMTSFFGRLDRLIVDDDGSR
jgi:hypothetical protein